MQHHYKTEKHLNNMKLLNQTENQQKNELVPEKIQKSKLSKKELQEIMKKILETVIAYEDDGMISVYILFNVYYYIFFYIKYFNFTKKNFYQYVFKVCL